MEYKWHQGGNMLKWLSFGGDGYWKKRRKGNIIMIINEQL